jgi:hypothetical protein
VNQGGTADSGYYSSLTDDFSVRDFFLRISPVPSGDAAVMLACKEASTFGTTSEIDMEQ